MVRAVTYYHGTDVTSAIALLGGKPLDTAHAHSLKIDGPPGFFLAARVEDAEFFALRRNRGAVLEIVLSAVASSALLSAGAVRRPIPRGPRSPYFLGDELHVPGVAFNLFNALRQAGDLQVFAAP